MTGSRKDDFASRQSARPRRTARLTGLARRAASVLSVCAATALALLLAPAPVAAQSPPDECSGAWAYFQYPANGRTFEFGSTIYVRVQVGSPAQVDRIVLYSNGARVRTEERDPYEWARSDGRGDNALRNLREGDYQLRAVVHDVCGQNHEYVSNFSIRPDETGGSADNGQINACNGNARFVRPSVGAVFDPDEDFDVEVTPERRQDIEHIELYVNDALIRREVRHPYEWGDRRGRLHQYLRTLPPGSYALRARVIDECGGETVVERQIQTGVSQDFDDDLNVEIGGPAAPDAACDLTAVFAEPPIGAQEADGDRLYVRIEPNDQTDVDSIDLYFNGEFVRTEERYPYEWARRGGGSDSPLRNVPPGLHTITAIVNGDCGAPLQIERQILVD